MARDYDAELARAMEKVARIKKAKSDALRRTREPIGKVMLELFSELERCDTEEEIKVFIEAHIQTMANDERVSDGAAISKNLILRLILVQLATVRKLKSLKRSKVNYNRLSNNLKSSKKIRLSLIQKSKLKSIS